MAKNAGRFGLGASFGPLVSSVGRGELIYGVIAGTDVTKTTSVMAETHATSRMNLSHDGVALNFGCRHILNEHAILIRPFGHELHSGDGQPLALIGYCGIQLLLTRRSARHVAEHRRDCACSVVESLGGSTSRMMRRISS